MKPDGEGEISSDVVAVLVNTAGFATGAAVAGMAPEIDTILRSVYSVAAEGKLDTDSINKLIDTMLKGEDLVTRMLANRIIEIVKLLGGSIINDATVIDLGELDPVLVKALADGYVDGFDMFKIDVRRRGGKC
jgi:NAD(P)-dependent dehydrogenase (short-subunit alcohol dehydrogenase family)